jgi:hypothetical protein
MGGLIRRAAVAAVAYLGLVAVRPPTIWVLCLFQGPSRAAVIQSSARLGIPGERLMDPVWLCPGRPGREGAERINAGQA